MARRTVHDLVNEAKAQVEELSVDQLQAELAAGTATVVDIRDFRERLAVGVIPGAVSAPRGMLEFWFDPESPYYQDRYQLDQRYVFHCASGWRSALAAQVIEEIGYTNVAHLRDGFTDWVESGADVEDAPENAKWMKRPRDEPSPK